MSQISELILVNTSYEEDVFEGTYSKFGYRISSRTIGSAKKRKVLVTVPYMNGHYDFSSMPISNDKRYTQNIYDNRTFTYIVQIPADDSIALYNKFLAFNDWLTLGVTRRFRDTTMPSLEWIGEVADTAFVEKAGYGEVTITMSVYPFAHNIFYEGGELWDNLNFEWDVIQELEFQFSYPTPAKTVTIINSSSIVQNPTIHMTGTSGAINVTVSDLTAVIRPGYNELSGIVLHPGENHVKMEWRDASSNADTMVRFIWKKEMA